MTKYLREITKAAMAIGATDGTYGVQFFQECWKGKTWEFDPMSDAVGQVKTEPTGNMVVVFNPVESTMTMPEDLNRKTEYVMSVENARELYKVLRTNPQYWFALDMASLYA